MIKHVKLYCHKGARENNVTNPLNVNFPVLFLKPKKDEHRFFYTSVFLISFVLAWKMRNNLIDSKKNMRKVHFECLTWPVLPCYPRYFWPSSPSLNQYNFPGFHSFHKLSDPFGPGPSDPKSVMFPIWEVVFTDMWTISFFGFGSLCEDSFAPPCCWFSAIIFSMSFRYGPVWWTSSHR